MFNSRKKSKAGGSAAGTGAVASTLTGAALSPLILPDSISLSLLVTPFLSLTTGEISISQPSEAIICVV